jgi:hypothetical protein
LQRIKRKEAEGRINSLVLITQKKEEEEEEEFASCSWYDYDSIIIWRRGKGEGDKFKIKQKIENVIGVHRLLYIPLTNELIFGSWLSLLQIWSPSSSIFTSKYKKRQKIEIPSSSSIWSLCQINKNNDTKSRRIEFASGHKNGQIMIWSKQQQQINESNHYSSIRTLKPFDDNYSHVNDLIFLNDNEFDCLISCSFKENKIKIFKGEEEEEEEELEHERVIRLIPMSNGQFASGGGRDNGSLNIWSPSSS